MLVQPMNASAPMWVTPSGMTTEERLLHLSNAYSYIAVRLDGMLTSTKLEHLWNAELFKLATESGMSMLLSALQLLNAP